MPIRSRLTQAAAVLGVLFLASPVTAHYAWEGELTVDEIRSTIIGNTLARPSYKGTEFAEYYAPDGAIHGVDSVDGAYKGKWSIRDDDLMCFAYEPDYAIVGCVMLFLDGDTVSFKQVDGTDEPAVKLLQGNPKGL